MLMRAALGGHSEVVRWLLGGFGCAAFIEDVNGTQGTGNAGMRDVLAAAEWVRREAPALGADPSRIVAFGESSGATDAQILTRTPAARGLVAGSISESGGLYARSLESALNATRRMGERGG